MDNTVHLTRSKNVEESFQKHLQRLNNKYPEIEGRWMSELAVDILRNEGVKVERVLNALQMPFYVMESSHAYPSTEAHYVFYTGESDYGSYISDISMSNPDHPRHRTFVSVLKGQLAVCAALFAQGRGLDDYLIVSKSQGTFEDNPHIHLLVYKSNHGNTEKGNDSKPKKKPTKDKGSRGQADSKTDKGGSVTLGAVSK